MRIGIAVGEVRGPATLEEIVGQVRTAAEQERTVGVLAGLAS
jgi:hypothetical protein